MGGWKSEGIDSSYFSSALMSRCAHVVSKQLVDLDRPVDILTRGVRETLWLDSQTYGEEGRFSSDWQRAKFCIVYNRK